MPDTQDPICETYTIEAAPAQAGGFIGRYGFPGKPIQSVRSRSGAMEIYDHEEDALAEAGLALCEALNLRKRWPKSDFKYPAMDHKEFAAKLGRIGLRPFEFATLYGTKQEVVMKWIDGEYQIPHPAQLLLEFISDPAGLARARAITEATAVVREGRSPR